MTQVSYERGNDKELLLDLASLRAADIILVGEEHNTRAHQREQARLITEIQPEYVLHEGWDDATPEETDKTIRCYALATLQDLVEKGVSLEQLGITKDVLQRIEQKKSEMYELFRGLYQRKGLTPAGASQEAQELVEDGVYPHTYDELLETPFYELGLPVCEAVQELLLNEPETEGDKRFRSVRERVAKRIRKQKLLHERTQGSDYLYRAIAETGGKLAGCDIRKNIPLLKDVIEENYQRGSVENQDAITGEETERGYRDAYDRYKERLDTYINKTMAWRERTMGARIVKYAKKRTGKKPIITIVGSYHARPDSNMYPILEIAGVRWRTIIQENQKNSAEDFEYLLHMMGR